MDNDDEKTFIVRNGGTYLGTVHALEVLYVHDGEVYAISRTGVTKLETP